MKHFLSTLLVMAGLLAAGPGRSQVAGFFPLDDLRPGMKATGKTVFEGNRIEEFPVEILGVLPGRPNPKLSVVLARLSGPQVDRTRVFAGMSGSPVYVNGKLLGAIAFAYPFATEAICGITPIQFMLDIGRKDGSDANSQTRPISATSFRELAQGRLSGLAGLLPPAAVKNESPDPMSYSSMQTLVPIAIPLAISGVSLESLKPLWSDFSRLGFMPVAGTSGGAAIAPVAPFDDQTLTPGSTVSVQLMRGDLTVEGIGTVTHRDGAKIYAFGHRLLNLGTTSMPMSEASVVTIVPNALNSFKVALSKRPVGSLVQDRASGVFGELGVTPRMIPVNIFERRAGGESRRFQFEIMDDPTLSPLLVQLSVLSTLERGTRSIGDVTIALRGKVAVRGESDVVVEDRFSRRGGEASAQASQVAALPVLALLSSGFSGVDIRHIDLEIESSEARNAGTLERVWINRTEANRGDRLQLQVYARTDDGRQFVERVPIDIPPDAPTGTLKLLVADGATVQALDPAANQIAAGTLQNLNQLIRTLNRVRRSDRLYVQLLRSSSGAIVNNEELPSLPPSVLATMESNRGAGGYTPVPYVRLKEIEIPPAEFVISGRREITINIVR